MEQNSTILGDQPSAKRLSLSGQEANTSMIDPADLAWLQQIKDGAQQRMDFARWLPDTLSLGTMPPITFDYIDDLSLNAGASADENGAYIGFNIGAVFIIREVFNRILAHPGTMLDVGHFASETAPARMPRLPTSFPHDTVRIVPNDPQRKNLADFMTIIALDFLLEHEHAHIRNGHVRLFNKITGQSYLAEFTKPAMPSPNGLLLQSFEMDADATAVGRGLARMLEHGESLGAAPIESYRLWASTVYTLFRILGVEHADIGNTTADYPPPCMRQMMILNVVFRHIGKKYGIVADPFVDGWFDDIVRVEYYVSLITDETFDPDGVSKAWGPEGDLHMRAILDYWKETTWPVLEPLSHTNIVSS